MTPEEMIEKIMADYSREFTITKATLMEVRKYFEDCNKSAQNRGTEFLLVKEKVIGRCLMVLKEGKPQPAEKIGILELLERELLISSKHNSNLFNTLYDILEKDDENVAIQASKAIDVLIKQINEKQQVTPGAVPLDLKQHYIKLFEFLNDKTEFLLKLKDHVKDPDFKVLKRQPYEENKDKEKKDIVFKNSKSLKFINQVPHLFIHLMAYAELDTKVTEEERKIKTLIRESIENIIQSLRKTPYQEFYNEFNFDFNNQLFAVMTKLLQFLFITLRSEKEERSREPNKSNQNLRKHINEQIEFIKVPEVIKNFIYLLKNCSEDFQLNRYEIVNRLKLLLCSLDKNKLSRNDAIEIFGELLSEETIYGKKKLLGDYSKNAICTYWIEIVKSSVLLNNVFYQPYLSIRQVSAGCLSEDSQEISSCFLNIQKLLEEVLKTIFDNTIYPSVQEKCIELLTVIMDNLFPEGPEHMNETNAISNSSVAKKVHENKLKIMLKILQAASLKFESIKNIFEEIDLYLTKKLGRKVCKDDLPEPMKLKHMQLNTLDISIAETDNFDSKVIEFIEGYNENIDGSLLTVIAVPNKFLTIYEEDDELCFNSHPVKTNNFTQYMKEVKTKLIEKCISLSHKLTKTFLIQNLETYTQAEMSSLKTIYFSLTNKRSLSSEQCCILSTILKNGLRIFEILHNYELHSDEQTNKRGHLKNFMLIFAQVYDPVNFRDIFEPNMEEFFKNLVKYAKHCADYCLQFVLIEPFCSNNNKEVPFNKNIVELLIYNLILRLESTSDILDPFHEFYGYKQEYFSLLQKLIRFPFRCLSRYADDSFIRNYFRQIILFLIKKAHTSRFCLDYLHLMRTLFKNILFNCNRDTASPLFSEFFAICSKASPSAQQPPQSQHSTFVNVNVLDNFMRLYETGIPELADIVTELIIMLPLKSKHIIQFAKQGYIVKPLLHCLCLMSDYNYTLRTLKTFEIIISHSNAEEINEFLDGVKEKLIDRLYHMVSDCNINDLQLNKINNELSPLSLKLLAKLGALSRNRELPLKMKEKDHGSKDAKLKELELVYRELKSGKVLKVEMEDSIEYAIEVFHKILDPYYQSIVFITMDMIEQCFELLKEVLPATLSKMHPLSERIICIFCNMLSLSSKYLTISQSILKHLRQEVKVIIANLTESITQELLTCGLNDYCKFFIQALVRNLSERVLITREDNFVKEISEEPKKFLWELIKSMLSSTENNADILCEYIIRLLISQVIMISNPQHIQINSFQSEYNHVLPYKNAALSCLNDIIDIASPAVLDETKSDILQSVYIVVTSVPDILNLKIMQHPSVIAKKIFDHMLKDEKQFLKFLQTEQGQRIFSNILENMVSYSSEAHKISASFLHKIMNETELSLPEIFYGGMRWDDIYDKSSTSTFLQSKFSLENLINEKDIKRCPITQLIKNLVKISSNISEENLKSNSRMLKMLSNAFLTYQLLIEVKYKGKKYHMFCILGKSSPDVDFSEQTAVFDKNFDNILKVAQAIIDLNSNLEGNYSKIIIEQAPPPNTNPVVPPPTANPVPQPPPRNPRDVRNTAQPPNLANAPAPNQTFNINPNTYIDDEEYGLNVQDFDMEVKTWSMLISSILKFLQSVLINDTVFNITKAIQKNKTIEKSPISEKRFKMILVMFELIGRVERTIRQTAYESIKELLSREDHPKELTPNDEKLKHLLKPVLISLQLDFKKFTPSFLHMFKKILKLLTQCFNLTLIQKLVDKLREMDKTKQQELATPRIQNPAQQKFPNYSEITTEVKCIANFLGLFKHLAYAFHSQRNARYSSNTLILIFKYVVSICDYFVPKLGKHTVNVYIKKVLGKVLNTMCQRITGEGIFNDGRERELEFSNLLEIIKMDDSYPLREKLTRETDYIEKFLTEFLNADQKVDQHSTTQQKKDYLTFLEIILELASRNNRWLKGMNSLAKQILNQLNHCIDNRQKKFEQRELQQIGQRNEIILLAKILLEFIKQNPNEIQFLFGLMNLFKFRTTFDLQQIKIYLRYQLYDNLSPEMRRKIFVDYLRMYKDPNRDTDRILAISQHIIYEFVLLEIAMEPEQRSILVNDEEVIKAILETIKTNLSPRLLHNRNSNIYREAIEILQISNLAMSALRTLIQDRERNDLLLNVWGLLRIEDKIIKHYAFVWTSNYIRYFDGLGQSKTLGLYLILIRALESLGHGDYEIGALIRKALNILIPYWDSRPREIVTNNSNNWIELSLRAVHDDTTEPTRLVRFWEIVVKNHHIFHKFKEVKFETQMVNSMQWLMAGNNPTSTNPLVKKIASDMSFIYIEWKYKEVNEKMKDCSTQQQKRQILESTYNERAAEICLNFFIKVALNNCNDKDDKEIMKRSLYLLKKTLILWPNTKKKFEIIKGVINRQKPPNTQAMESPLRFQYTLLNIINILLMYETDDKLLPQLTNIFKLIEMGQVSPPRMPSGGNPGMSNSNSIFNMSNIYLMNLLCIIVKRLLKVAMANPEEPESIRLINEIHSCIKDGFDYYVFANNNRTRNNIATTGPRAPVTKKIEIEIVISFLKIIFDLDHTLVEPHLNNIKQATSWQKKIFEKGFESTKNTNNTRVYDPPQLTEGTFAEMMNKNLEINTDLIKPDALAFAEENFEKEMLKSYSTKRPLFVVLLRILASKINMIHLEEQGNTLDIFITIYEKIADPELKIEVINILKCLFIGPTAFPDNTIPDRYAHIPIIDYDEKKIFYLLFEDNSKFNTHFEKRKMKPSDPNYNLNDMLYEEITAKVYFDFLCMYILHLKNITAEYLEKIRIFILYSIKIASPHLIDRIFQVLDERYLLRNRQGLFLALFEDYKDLNCAEDYLQGDEIMLFFTIYLYRKVTPKCSVELSAYGVTADEKDATKFERFYLRLIKSDINSPNHLSMIKKIFKTSIELWGESNPSLPMILKQYLLTGSYNEQWGSILLQIALDYDCLSSEQLVAINSSIVDWGTIARHCQESKRESCRMFMDYVCKIYGDQDLICGYRMGITRSPDLQQAMCSLQQRRYIDTLKNIQKYKQAQAKRERTHALEMDNILDEPELNLNDLLEDNLLNPSSSASTLHSFQKQNDEIYMNDMIKESYKNLNKWDELVDNNGADLETKIEYLFHCGDNKTKLVQILTDIQSSGMLQFGYYYGKSVQHFFESPSTANRDLNMALFYSLVQWLCFPKNARHQQNNMLVKIECLIELEEGEKIKDESNFTSHNNPPTASDHKEYLDTLAKVVQSIYTEINYWRERMPNKNEDLTVWNAILGQRNMLYEFIKKKIICLFEAVVNSASHNNSYNNKPEKLLVPYTDIEWNKLKLMKQNRNFDVYTKDKTIQSNLYLDEVYLRDKERFYETMLHKKDMVSALKIIDDQSGCKDEEQEKVLKSEMLRLKAKVYKEKGSYVYANQIYTEAVNMGEQPVLAMCSLWRDWMVMSCEAYEKTGQKQWAYTAISTLPFSLRHKPHKTKLLLAPIFKILKEFLNDSKMKDLLETIIENHQLPMKPLLHWFPQIFKLAVGDSLIAGKMADLLQHMSDQSFSTIFFLIKPFLFRSQDPRADVAKNLILKGMKNINYHLTAKLERFSQLLAAIRDEQKISVMTLGEFCQCFTRIPLPLVEVESSHSSSQAWIIQVSEMLTNEVMNNKKGKIITFLGSDGKQYQYRLETVGKRQTDREYENLLSSQLLSTINGYLELDKEASSRNLHIKELKRIHLREDLIIMKNNKHSVTLLDVLNDYMNKQTTFGSEYPESDKSFFRLPKTEINKTVNKRMKEIVPETVLKSYILDKAESYDEYISFRKTFGYQYGVICTVNYVMGIDAMLDGYQFDMKTGYIHLNEFKINVNAHKVSPFSVRLSRNIQHFLTPVHVNSNILPAMAATVSALCAPKLSFKEYSEYLFSDLPQPPMEKPDVYKRVKDLLHKYTKQRKILEVAETISTQNSIPYEYKYWF